MSEKILYTSASIWSPPNRDPVAKSYFLIFKVLEPSGMFRWFTIKMYMVPKSFSVATKKFGQPLHEYSLLRFRAL